VRALFVIVAAVLVGFVVSPLLRADAACKTASAASIPSNSPVSSPGKWSDEQVANARIIVTIGDQRKVPAEAKVIAVATALQESRLRNLRGGDRDSIGLFQQRPSQGWGTPRQLSDPAYQTQKFYDKLLAIHGWRRMRVTEAAQAVQISAFPEAYAKHETAATRLVGTLSAAAPAASSCEAEV
jgi:hypothetical protein